MVRLTGEDLTIQQVAAVARQASELQAFGVETIERMQASYSWTQATVAGGEISIYGVTTGFGALATSSIAAGQAERLSRNLVLSSLVGVGAPLAADLVRAMILIRANTFAKGHSGVRPELAETLLAMLNRGVTPLVPSKGSLGASGDLAPLAHIAAVISREPDGDSQGYSGQAWYQGELLSGAEAMRRADIPRLVLQAKEGLALTNGTNFMLAACALGLHDAQGLVRHAEIAAALSLEGLLGISAAFDPRLHTANRQPGQVATAANLLALCQGSRLIDSDLERVQDAYSLRCTPQVLGPVRDMLDFLEGRVNAALNAAADNPLIFHAGEGADQGVAISGGNFHGQGPALWLDTLAIAAAQIGAIAERRTFRMTTPELSHGLPSMLVLTSGLDSGMMMPQYTAAALVSENKTLAHPDSVDSIPSSANQEDYVSMGANAARHALEVISNVRYILAVELLTAAQAVELRPQGAEKLGLGTAAAYRLVRQRVKRLEHDRELAPDIEALAALIAVGELLACAEKAIGRRL